MKEGNSQWRPSFVVTSLILRFLCVCVNARSATVFLNSSMINHEEYAELANRIHYNELRRLERVSSLMKTQSGSYPNILLIVADDLGTGDVPGYFDDDPTYATKVNMPHLRKMVKNGVTFTDAHSSPLCAPSRYMLLSGNYPHRGRRPYGTWALGSSQNQFRRRQRSIAQALQRKQVRYDTAMMGKWHMGGKIMPDGLIGNQHVMLSNPDHNWSQPFEGGPQDIGFDTSFISDKGVQGAPYAFFRNGILNLRNGIKYWKRREYEMPMGISKIPKAGEGDGEWDSSAYNMLLVNETANFLDEHMDPKNGRNNDPFFAYVALGAVHIPHSPPYYFQVNDGDNTLQPVAGEYPVPFMDMVSEVDMAVGSLTRILKERNLLKDTIVIFTSDNGGLRGAYTEDVEQYGHYPNGKLAGSKSQIWEGGHRVPLIMRYQGNPLFPSGETRDKVVGLNDIYATLCDIVGVRKARKSGVDSVSFAEYLLSNDEADFPREYLATWTHGNVCSPKYGKAIRKGKYKLIKVAPGRLCVEKTMLFDLSVDISEQNDISSKPELADLIAEMDAELTRLYPEFKFNYPRTTVPSERPTAVPNKVPF